MSATPLPSSSQGEDLAAALAAASPFADLPPAVVKAVAEISQARFYNAGEAVFSLGQYDGDEFFLVKSGRLKAASADPESGALLIDELPAGEFFGLAEAVVGEETAAGGRHLTLTAEIDSTVVAIDAAGFRAVVAQRPSLTRNLMLYFARALAATAQAGPVQDSAPERRVFAALLEYVERDAVSGLWRIPRMPRHRELAEKAGADEAATAGAIALLIQEGVARRDYPGLIIDDIAELNRLAS
ncbi:Crp/Fnr family transcriptional regulator [Amphiplicatus metriothermophilus]|uniref:cAMP-binding domain of CRP or a regulatory subunit of cAMP-dependent protein kinases n=1 Tax=Amphiplicatus metriothermophilus TaxID=1519374 RepID=A0A239PJE8_9PROT|nr:cyclic nucleotide-binding domain-containing protein [Amphiplicatus metriothermophilus]MBB5517977.1 CRP-like cAMP-binding protein [Amphiplicatus metriothermophilus]SNT67690.1 cAMP-binding domain of CRP or a regulatory subunit of cAMP-dependent protein kinases [Amphiplicatus metriothermophilus]